MSQGEKQLDKKQQDEKPNQKKPNPKKTFPLPHENLTPEWLSFARRLRPDLPDESIQTAFRQFAFYFTDGKKANAYRTLRGWNQTWGNWIGRHQDMGIASAQPVQSVQPVFAKKPDEVDQQTWDDFNASRKTPLTQTAFDELKKEVNKVKEKYPEQSLATILSLCCAKDWKSFQAVYFFNEMENNKSLFTDPGSKPISVNPESIKKLWQQVN